MLKALRRRFVVINMAIVLVMLCVILGLLLGFTRQSLARESVAMMQSVAADPMQLNWPGATSRLPYFTVRLSPFGGARVSGYSVYDLKDADFLTELINRVLSGNETTGLLPDYSLRYYRTVQGGSEYIIFADVSSESATLRGLGRSCVFIGLGALAVFLLISVLLARWAVKPVAAAWKQQTQFVSDASHELKTPLTVILTNAELLNDPDYDQAARSGFAANILTMAGQMRGLVESLLELARADNGTLRAEFTDVDLSALAENAALPFEPVLYEKGLTLDTRIEPEIFCRGSESHLRQAVEILLDNAGKYSDPGTVTLSLARQGRNHCRLSVSNPGAPLSDKERKDIFKRFYRADKARAMDHSYGLGLSIAQRIALQHKGKIWCESGSGRNTFIMQLPIRQC